MSNTGGQGPPTRSGWTIPLQPLAGFARSQASEEVNDALKMIRLRRPAVWILLLVGLLLAVEAGAAGAYLALKHSGSGREEGFLAHGQVSAAIFGGRRRYASEQAVPRQIRSGGHYHSARDSGDHQPERHGRWNWAFVSWPPHTRTGAPGKSWFAPGVLPIYVYSARDGEQRGQIYGRYRHSEGTVFDG